MKKAGYITFVVVFFLICILPVAAMALSSEKGFMDERPRLYTAETGINMAFGEEAEGWLSANFAGRKQLVTLNGQVTGTLFRTSPQQSVIWGRDGWLFYVPTLDDYLGTHPLAEEEINDLATTLKLVQEYVETQGGQFLFMVAPNKNSLYGEFMPFYTRPATPGSGFETLNTALDGAQVNYLDLYTTLSRSEHPVYHKRDTHWNNEGALIAYNAMMDALEHPHDDFFAAQTTVEQIWPGDLDRLLLPARDVLDEQVVYDIDFDSLFQHVGPRNTELSRLSTAAPGGQGELLFFRDSFGNALLPFVATAFEQAMFVRATPITPDLMQAGQTVAFEIAQRNLRTLLEAAPRMPAPLRGSSPARAADGQATLYTRQADGYLHVYGVLDEDTAREISARGVALQSAGSYAVYEAFPILEEKLLETQVPGAYGFSLYLPEDVLPGDEYTLLPVVYSGNEWRHVPLE